MPNNSKPVSFSLTFGRSFSLLLYIALSASLARSLAGSLIVQLSARDRSVRVDFVAIKHIKYGKTKIWARIYICACWYKSTPKRSLHLFSRSDTVHDVDADAEAYTKQLQMSVSFEFVGRKC